jgi:hypothetical protein
LTPARTWLNIWKACVGNRNVKDRFFVVGDLVLRRKQKT